MNITTYVSTEGIRSANRAINSKWFDASNMLFFHTSIIDKVYKGVYFITSEYPNGGATEYSVRCCINGEIETFGKFHSFVTAGAAERLINELPVQLPQAFLLAKEEVNGRSDKGGFAAQLLLQDSNPESLSFACQYLTANCETLDHPFIKWLTEPQE